MAVHMRYGDGEMSGDATWELSRRGGDAVLACVETAATNEGAPDRVLPCAEAARLLDVSPTALQTWSQRLAFPRDVGGAAGPRFRRVEIEALRDALPDAHSVTGAIRAARQRVLHL